MRQEMDALVAIPGCTTPCMPVSASGPHLACLEAATLSVDHAPPPPHALLLLLLLLLLLAVLPPVVPVLGGAAVGLLPQPQCLLLRPPVRHPGGLPARDVH
jgi:hypothetical protein